MLFRPLFPAEIVLNDLLKTVFSFLEFFSTDLFSLVYFLFLSKTFMLVWSCMMPGGFGGFGWKSICLRESRAGLGDKSSKLSSDKFSYIQKFEFSIILDALLLLLSVFYPWSRFISSYIGLRILSSLILVFVKGISSSN